jgi:hypothetical protein
MSFGGITMMAFLQILWINSPFILLLYIYAFNGFQSSNSSEEYSYTGLHGQLLLSSVSESLSILA